MARDGRSLSVCGLMASSSGIRRLAFISGIVLLVAAPALAFGAWFSTRAPRQAFDAAAQHRTPGDSGAYASSAYHASRAEATLAARWTLTGFATLGLVGFLVGVGLVLYGRPAAPLAHSQGERNAHD